MKRNQNRLWVVVAVLILIIVVLAGVLGWYVLNSGKDSNQANRMTTTATKSPNGQPGYLFIDEWDVKIPVDDEVGPMYYTMDKNIAFIRSEKLDATGEKDCTTNTIYVTRGYASDKVPQEDSNPIKTFQEVYDGTSLDELTLNIRSIKVKIGDYYYVAPRFSGSSCIKTSSPQREDEAHDQELLNKQIAESKAAVAVVHAVNKLTQK